MGIARGMAEEKWNDFDPKGINFQLHKLNKLGMQGTTMSIHNDTKLHI